jgi:ribosomal protein S18 acetylase RimI-like enzyme
VTTVEIRILGDGDGALLENVAPEVFDNPVDARWSAEFLADPRHHLAVALDAGAVVGMASGLHYVHPDKPPELWVDEVAVAPTHQGRGIGKRLMGSLFERARELGCAGAWVLTESDNTVARRLYASVGGKETPQPPIMYEFDLGTSPSP